MSRLAFAAALLCVAACGDSGSDSGGAGSGGAPQGGEGGSGAECGTLAQQFTSAECGVCAEASCCAELAACDTGTECGDLLDCEAGCQTQACTDDCAAGIAGGVTARDGFQSCLGDSCAAECEVVSEGICGTNFTTLTVECDECVEGACCDEVEACVADNVCAGCLEDASGAACADDSVLAGMESCFTDSCSQVCDG